MKPKAQSTQQTSITGLVKLDPGNLLLFVVSALATGRAARKESTSTDKNQLQEIDQHLDAADLAVASARNLLGYKESSQPSQALARSRVRASDQTGVQETQTVEGAFQVALSELSQAGDLLSSAAATQSKASSGGFISAAVRDVWAKAVASL